MAKSSELIKIAQSWIGKKESDGTHKDIIDIYNSHRPLARGYAVKYTDAWCATTISALSIVCKATDIIPTECSCEKMIELFKKLGVWIEDENRTPRAGDIIFYDWNDSGKGDNKGWCDHVGIVEKVSDKSFTVIEGNYSNSVKRRTIDINARYIRGFATPKYEEESVSTELKPGDVITLKEAKYYNGKNIPAWVMKKTLYYRGTNNNGVVFSILKTGAVTGTVKADNVVFNKVETSGSNEKPTVIGTAVSKTIMNIRAASNTSGKILGWLGKGKTVEVLEVLSNGWYKIVYTKAACGYAYVSNSGNKYFTYTAKG